MAQLQLIDTLYETWYINEDDFPTSGSASDKLQFLLKYAVLAPSSHNSQPWLFTIRDSTLALFADRTRSLSVVDPADRELVISCGAALFFLRVAMRHYGYQDHVRVMPDVFNSDLLAWVRLGPERQATTEEDDLFYAIFKRRTNRKPFEERSVPGDLLDELEGAATEEDARLGIIEGDDLRNEVAEIVSFADREQWADPSFRRELASWVHANRSISGDGMPAYAFGLGNLASIAAPLVVRTFDRGNGTAAKNRHLASGSPALALLTTNDDTQKEWLEAGQALARVLLHAAAHDVSASFLDQPIEMPDLRRKLAALCSVSGYPQILLRLGYGPEVGLTSRRPIRDVLR